MDKKQSTNTSQDNMNTLHIQLPYSYCAEHVRLNWSDILFAVQHGFLSLRAVVDFAFSQVELDDPEDSDIVQFAGLLFDSHYTQADVLPYLTRLAAAVPPAQRAESREKLLFLLLEWVYEHPENFKDPLLAVEYLYDDFEFPAVIAPFVRYLPMTGPDLGSQEKNTQRLFRRWQQYLEQGKQRWEM